MTPTKILAIHPEIYRGGWVVVAEISNGVDSRNITFYWELKTKPTERDMAERLAKLAKNFDDNQNYVPEKNYTESEVVAELITKKYLAVGQKFSDLPVKAIAAIEEVVE